MTRIVLLYSCDKSNPDRQGRALEIVAGADDGVLLWQAAGEFVGTVCQVKLRAKPTIVKSLYNRREVFPMGSAKKVVLDLVKALPDDSSLEDIQYQLYLRQKVERSLRAATEGRTKTHAEVKKRLTKWLEK